jgi:outer membrane protein
VKNLSLVLNVVLLIAVGILYFMHFSENSDKEQETPEVESSGEYTMAYINSDSVLQNYEFFKKIQGDLQKKTAQLEAEYQNRAQGLQKEVNDYQQNASNLTMGQARALEENLMQKQQNLQLYQQKLSQDLMTEENKMSQELYKKLSNFLREYGEANDLKMVVRFNQGSDVLYANDALDITQPVIKGLNEEYTASLAQPESDTTAVE